jgi:quinol monooxygenase YgiN
MFQAIAIHHARAEHVDDFVAFMHRVIDHVGDAPGLIEFTAWRETETTTLIGLSRWESPEAFAAALPTIMELGPERRPEWSERDDEVMRFVAA